MKISIITATWNSGATLRDTMESVLSQDYTDFEHLIIDGGSTDNTLDIVRELEPRYGGKLKWISERDRGIYDAMNKGIMMATGDVIGILNSDDFYTSTDILSTVADGIQQYDAVYADIHYVDPADLTRPVRHYSSLHSADGRCDSDSCLPTHRSTAAGRYIHDSVCLTSTLKLPPTLSNCSDLFI